VVEEPGMCGSSLHGNREIPRPASRKEAIWSASGRRGAIADGELTWEVRVWEPEERRAETEENPHSPDNALSFGAARAIQI
jgi:hypothetical protein